MKFTKNHQIVKSWVALVLAGTYTVDQVPKLFNLRDVVIEVLSEQAAEASDKVNDERGINICLLKNYGLPEATTVN